MEAALNIPARSLPPTFLLTATLLLSCNAGSDAPAPPVEPEPSGPVVVALGTVQDGGLPHASCSCVRCEAGRNDPGRARNVASLAVWLPDSDRVYVIDASPDIRAQLDRIAEMRGAPSGTIDRNPLAGVLLTHAHLGHYTGLAFFGYEAMHSSGLPVLCTTRMAEYLRTNGPWSQLVDKGNIALLEILPGEPVDLGEGVSVTAVSVPHRDEYADTVGYVVRGPRASVLYIPDTEPWERWDTPPEALFDDVDVALLDGTFYSGDELPGRDLSEIGHPLVVSTMDRLQSRVDAGSLRVLLTHLNHSNPALDPDGEERAEMHERGFEVLSEGARIPL